MLAIAAFLLLCQENPAPLQEPPPKTESSSFLDPLGGWVSMRYRFRTNALENDSDLYEIIGLNWGNPDKDVVTASVIAKISEDLDGNRNVLGYYPFTSLADSYGGAVVPWLYTAYLEAHPGAGVIARAGRQSLEEFPEAVSMDGGWLRVPVSSQFLFSVFGGVPTNLFESYPQGDFMYGASVEWNPEPGRPGRYRVEYLHLRDENLFGLHDDDLLGFSIDEAEGPFTFHARYKMLETASRDLLVRLGGNLPEAEFLFDLQATYVFRRIGVLSFALDPYSSFLMAMEPYLDLVGRISKSFGGVFSIDASVTSRRLVNGAVDATYNHEFQRYEIAPSLHDWPLPNVSIRAAADFWNSSGNDFWSAGGDLVWTLHPDVKISIGSTYALYSIDALTGEERYRVRLYTALLKVRVNRGSSFDVRFSFEQTAAGDFRVMEFGFRHAF